jgi:PAS domain S-box-containing protein
MTINRKFVMGWLAMLWLAITLLGVGLSLESNPRSILAVGFFLLTTTATLITLQLSGWLRLANQPDPIKLSEAELHDLFAAIDDVVLVVNAEGRYCKIAPTNPNNFYKPPAELLGKTMHEVLPSQLADYFLSCIQQTLEQQQIVDLDYELPIGNRSIWFSGRISPIAADQVILVARDITTRKQTEQALQESKAKYRALLNTLPDLVIHCNAEGIYLDIFASESFPMIGRGKRIIGTDLYKMLPLEAAQQRMTAIKAALATREMQIYEQELLVQGNLQIEECRVMDCGNSEVLILVRDITERKRSEQLLQSLIESTATTTGEAFFSTLVEKIAIALSVNCVMVGKRIGDYIEILGMTAAGQRIPNHCTLIQQSPCAYVFQNGQFYCQTGLQTIFPNHPNLTLLNADSYLGLAIRDVSGNMIGVVCILDSQPIVLSESTETLLKIFADRAGAEIERLQAVTELQLLNQNLELRVRQRTEQLQHQTQKEQILNQIVQLVRSSLDLDTIFSTTTQAVAELLNIGKAIIAQYQPDQAQWVQIAEYRCDSSLADTLGMTIPDAENPFADQLKRFEIVQVDDTRMIQDGVNHPLAQIVPGAWLMLPLVVNQQIWGALVFLQGVPASPYSETEIELGQRIADQLAIAIQQANLYQQVQAEKEKLRYSEAILAEAQQIAHVGNWELDVTTQKNTWSAELFRIFGLDPTDSEPDYTNLFNYIYPDDRPRLQQVIEQAIAVGIPYEIDLRILKPNNSIGYIEVRGEVEQNKQEQVIRVFGTALDITERKRTEAALQQSEVRLRATLEQAAVGIVEADMQGCFTRINQKFCEIVGYSEAELVGKAFANITHPDDVAPDHANVRRLIEGACSTFTMEKRYIHKNGHWIWAVLSVSMVQIQSGERYFIGVVQDISDRKRTEQALRQSEQRFRTLFEATLNPIQGYNHNREVIFWNQASEALYGYSREEALGQRVEDLIIPPEFHAAILPIANAWIAGTGNPLPNGELELQHKDGSRMTVHSSHIMLTNLDGEPEMYCIDMDLRELKQAQVMLQQANTQLELRVEERTAELRQAKEVAEAANRAKSVFLANMSHELRTPLNGILGYAQILQRNSLLAKDEQRGLDIIYQCGEHLLDLINDLLDLSKIEAQKLELTPQAVHFGNLLSNVTSMFRLKAEQKGLEFIAQFSPELPVSIQVDAKRLQQILLNLLSNAIKFTDQGSVTFRVEIVDTAELSADHCNAVHSINFQVQDTGIGIAPHQLETIFLPFEQVGQAARQAEGTGLGLAITRTLVRMMGGELLVESILHQGSTFKFELPLSVLATPDLPAPASLAKQSVIGFQGSARRILIVDDHWTNRAILIDLLQPLGFILMEAENGLEGLQQTTTFRPDLIITDLRMPVMDGWEMTRQLRTNSLLQNICVIAVSALPFQQIEPACYGAGCNDFVAKPIQAEVLLDKLKLHLQLEWVYGTAPSEAVLSALASSSTPLVPPSEIELNQLYDLAQKGRILRIAQQAEVLKRDPRLVPFANALIQLAENFEVEKLLQFIAQFASP